MSGGFWAERDPATPLRPDWAGKGFRRVLGRTSEAPAGRWFCPAGVRKRMVAFKQHMNCSFKWHSHRFPARKLLQCGRVFNVMQMSFNGNYQWEWRWSKWSKTEKQLMSLWAFHWFVFAHIQGCNLKNYCGKLYQKLSAMSFIHAKILVHFVHDLMQFQYCVSSRMWIFSGKKTHFIYIYIYICTHYCSEVCGWFFRVRFFLKEVSSAHQDWIFLIKNISIWIYLEM